MNILREIVEDLFYKYIVPEELIILLETIAGSRYGVYLLIPIALLVGVVLYRFWF